MRVVAETKESSEDFHTIFGTPEIKIQKRIKEPNKPVGGWEKFEGWKGFLEKYCQRPDAGDLLNSPIGPLLIEKISDSSGVKDIILKQSKRDEIKTDLANVKKDLDETHRKIEEAKNESKHLQDKINATKKEIDEAQKKVSETERKLR